MTLHPIQEELLINQAISIDNPRQAVSGYLVLTGRLDRYALHRVLTHLPVAFDVLRWRFHLRDAKPAVCLADEEVIVPVQTLDFRHVYQPQREADAWMQGRVRQSFAMHKQALYELTLLQTEETKHYLFIRCHRLLMDNIGFDLMCRYILDAYARLVAGDDLPEPAPTYSEDVSPARLYLNSLAYTEDRMYWSRQFADGLKPLLKPRSNAPADLLNTIRLTVDDELKPVLSYLSAESAYSLTQLTLAALTVYFARVTQQSSCVFGRLMQTRQTKRQRETVGQFTRLVPFRSRYRPEQTLRKLLILTRNQQRADFSHREYPLSHLSALLGHDADPQSMMDIVVSEETGGWSVNAGGITWKLEPTISAWPGLPIHLLWGNGKEGEPLTLQITHRLDYLSEAEVRSFVSQILHLFAQFPRRLDAPLSALDLLGPAQRSFRPKPYTAAVVWAQM